MNRRGGLPCRLPALAPAFTVTAVLKTENKSSHVTLLHDGNWRPGTKISLIPCTDKIHQASKWELLFGLLNSCHMGVKVSDSM